MSKHYQVAVIGSGPGGYVAALKAAQLGASTAVVERHPFFGGTCLNWGCIPSKAILATAELAHRMSHGADMGIVMNGSFGVDWSSVQSRKDDILKNLRNGIKGLFRARKITAYQGIGKLDGEGRIVIRDDAGKTDVITADKIILATGSVPARLPGWPEDPEFVCTSDEALHWKTLPKKLLIVGGGVIGCEFACMMQPLGVDVTIVEIMPKLLLGMDYALADLMHKSFKARGIKVHLDTKVSDVKLAGGAVKVTLGGGDAVTFDRVLLATGRRPNTMDLGLESLGITTNQRGFIEVNDRMETARRGIYCIGDANGKCLLAHAASAHGVVAAQNALGADHAFHSPVPSCVYTFPEVAAVGMTQETAREKGIPFAVGTFPLAALGKAMAAGDTEGFAKVIRHRETGQLLGVHMAGHNVTEVIAAAGAMLTQNASVHELADTVFAHPTISESIKEAAEDALYMGLHLPPRKMMKVVAG